MLIETYIKHVYAVESIHVVNLSLEAMKSPPSQALSPAQLLPSQLQSLRGTAAPGRGSSMEPQEPAIALRTADGMDDAPPAAAATADLNAAAANSGQMQI